MQFSIDDLGDVRSLERVLRQFEAAINAPVKAAKLPTPDELAPLLAPMIRDELQSTGSAPLNLQSLLPNVGTAVVIVDTHANRLTLYPAANYPIGTLFWESDRTVFYTVTNFAGVLSWTYSAGMFATTHAGRPTDLGTSDNGFLMWITVQNHVFRWTGAAWFFIDDEGGRIVDRVSAPTGLGWQLCDGTATDYLQLSGADIAVTAFTTPDMVTAPAGVYRKSAAAYTGTINPAVPAAITGSTGSSPTGITVDAHPVIERLDDAGAGIWVFDAEADADHVVNDPEHTHDEGTLVNDDTSEPINLEIIPYFRR